MKRFDREQRAAFWAACKTAYNRGRFELAKEIEEQIKLASTVDADELRIILYRNLGGGGRLPDGTLPAPSREERNSKVLVDDRKVLPDYVAHRCTTAAGDAYGSA